MVRIDRLATDDRIQLGSWLHGGGTEGARAVRSTAAGSMITGAGVVFSITIVALTLASGQFGSRLLRTFMRDVGNQVVLGTFIATFVYCLLVLCTVGEADGRAFVPHLSITVALVLAITCIDRLGQALCRLAERSTPSPYRHDGAGRLRVVAPTETFGGLLACAFDPIRRYGGQHPSVMIRLLETIAAVAWHTRGGRRRDLLREHADAALSASLEALTDERDRAAVRAKYGATLAALGDDGDGRARRDGGARAAS